MKPKECKDIPEDERLKHILENWEHCDKHSWKKPQKEKYFGLLYNRDECVVITRCRYCGQDKASYDHMNRIMAEEALSRKYPPDFDGMILGGPG